MKDGGPFDIEVSRQSDGVSVVVLNGEVDIYTAPRLRDALMADIDAGVSRIVVDLSAVPFIDSSGLGVLVVALRRLKEHGGCITLVCAHENVIRAFRLTGLLSVFPLHANRDDAVAEARDGGVTRSDP